MRVSRSVKAGVQRLLLHRKLALKTLLAFLEACTHCHFTLQILREEVTRLRRQYGEEFA